MSNAEENTELSRCGSLTDNLEHRNTQVLNIFSFRFRFSFSFFFFQKMLNVSSYEQCYEKFQYFIH